MDKVQALAGTAFFAKQRNALHVVLKDSVCGGCNNGWMSQLEISFINVFRAQLSRPSQCHLDPLMQERVATWAVKTALLLMIYTESSGMGPGGYVPKDNLRWLYENQDPPSLPPGTKVWLGTVANPGNRPVFHQAAALGVEANGPITAYFSTFTLGYLIFQVFGHDIYDSQNMGALSRDPTIGPPSRLSGRLTEIWPGNGNKVAWPTAKPLQAAEVPGLHLWPNGTV